MFVAVFTRCSSSSIEGGVLETMEVLERWASGRLPIQTSILTYFPSFFVSILCAFLAKKGDRGEYTLQN